MFYQIAELLLQVVFGFLAVVCLLRLLMQYQGVSLSPRAGNPLGPFIFAATNWLVMPLRRVLPAMGRVDTSSLVAAFLLVLVERLLLWLLQGSYGSLGLMVLVAVFDLLRLMISCLTGLVIVYAVLSWVQSDSPVAALVARIVAPMLRPIRRMVPLVGGIDLSPLVFLVVLQVIGIVLNTVQRALMA